jgi:hypothetical protein
VTIISLTKTIVIASLLLTASRSYSADAGQTQVEYHGAGWMQFGQVVNSFTAPSNTQNDYTGNWMQFSGGQVSATAHFDNNWEGSFGLGSLLFNLPRGSIGNASLWYPFWVSYVPEARITYSTPLFTQEDKLQFNMGSFGYNYNSDIKDMGLYLLRGYVYPGTLVSGFGNLHGVMAGYQAGAFQNNLIANLETEDKPLYDISIADVVSYKVMDGIELGAGVNFYRLISQNSRQTSPGKNCDQDNDFPAYAKQGQPNACFLLDTNKTTNVVDTVTGSYAGTKLMGRVHLDPKALFGMSGGWGKSDWVLYSEVAVIGLKDYNQFYNDIKQRIPVVVGFNFPMHNLVDNLSLEVEYYASKNSSDNIAAQNGSWIPAISTGVNTKRDDWKWSLSTSKVFLGHMKLAAQVANDHLRIGGSHNVATGVEVTSTPKDWYWTSTLAYFF